MNDVYYFSHDSNARNDEKILMFRAEHGWQGYGLYWALIEMMFENKDTCLHHDRIKGIAISYNIDTTLLQGVINTAITEHLFDSDGMAFWSDSLRQRKVKMHDLIEKRSNAGKKGMEIRWAGHKKDDADNIVITKNNKGKKGNKKDNTYSAFFESVWALYPHKRGKAQISPTQIQKLEKVGLEHLSRCIKRYKDSKEKWQQWQNGSTFFNSGYVDFLDENYVETKEPSMYAEDK